MANWPGKASRLAVAAAACALALAAGGAGAQQTPDFQCLTLTSTRSGPERGSPLSPLLHELAQRLPEALARCEEGVKIRPKEGRMFGALARVRAMAGDAKGARDAAQIGAELGSSTAQVLLGAMLADGRDYKAALQLFRKAARDGHPIANFNLGVMWANGMGVSLDAKDAAASFNLAALGDDSAAMQVLGEMHAAGRGVAADQAKAQQWWKKAAEAMGPEGARNPLRIAALGRAEIDKAALLSWYEQRAQAGELWAQAYLGALYESGQWVRQDYSAAAFWYSKAGSAGHVVSQFRMQKFHMDGLGVARDPAEARRWGQMWQIQRCETLVSGEPVANECDRFASDGYDPAKVVRGVDTFCVQHFVSQAIAACKRAAAEQPSVVRFRAQHARALAHAGRFEEARREAAIAAAKGSTPAMILLGVMSQRGLGVPKNEAEALRWYRKAADAGDERAAHLVIVSAEQGVGVAKGSAEAAALVEATRSRLFQRSPAPAAPSLLSRAEKGDRQAQHNLAAQYEQQKNYDEAVKWYARAAEQGWGMSAMNLAQMYEKGIGVKQSSAEAMKRYRVLADQGNDDARYRLAGLYANSGDYAQAAVLYRKGIEHDDYRAMLDLGPMYEHGRGVQKDLSRAAGLYEKAADRSRWARAKIGAMYLSGTGVPKDYAKALRWLQRASDEGDSTSHNNLGQMYEQGWGVQADYRKARDLYLAALYGAPEARGNLESLYERDLGTPADPAEAAAWYRPGASAGIAEAQFKLGRRYAKGEGVPRDDLEAARWLTAAAEQGHAKARQEAAGVYFSLAQRYERGDQTFKKDEQQAMEAYVRAALFGHARAAAIVQAKIGRDQWLALQAYASRVPALQKGPTGLTTDPGEDKQKTIQVRAGSTSSPQVMASDAGMANVYVVIPWWPPIDAKDAKQSSERKQ